MTTAENQLCASIALMRNIPPDFIEEEAAFLAGDPHPNRGRGFTRNAVRQRRSFWLMVASIALPGCAACPNSLEPSRLRLLALRTIESAPVVLGGFLPVAVSIVAPSSEQHHGQ